jgi:[ribosomal protein S5]-alanine N-acetyltransferase
MFRMTASLPAASSGTPSALPATLMTARLSLRPLHATDEALYCAWFTDPVLMAHIGPPLDAAQAARAFHASLGMTDLQLPTAWLWIASTREDGATVGLVGLVTRDGLPEIGSVIVPSQQGKGFAYEALSRVRDEGFGRLGLPAQYGCQLPSNARSIGLMLKLGFRQVPGRSDRIHWQLDRGAWQNDLGRAPSGVDTSRPVNTGERLGE